MHIRSRCVHQLCHTFGAHPPCRAVLNIESQSECVSSRTRNKRGTAVRLHHAFATRIIQSAESRRSSKAPGHEAHLPCLPLLQVREFSQLPGERVEAVVRPREPLDDGEGAGIVKLAGEDALLDWPDAVGPGADVLPLGMPDLCGHGARARSARVWDRRARVRLVAYLSFPNG